MSGVYKFISSDSNVFVFIQIAINKLPMMFFPSTVYLLFSIFFFTFVLPYYHFIILISSRLTVCFRRKSAITIAKPTAASAAATVITKNTNTCPVTSPRNAEKATKVRLTEFSINSIDINTMIAFRRVTTPTAPIINIIALRIRYDCRETIVNSKVKRIK